MDVFPYPYHIITYIFLRDQKWLYYYVLCVCNQYKFYTLFQIMNLCFHLHAFQLCFLEKLYFPVFFHSPVCGKLFESVWCKNEAKRWSRGLTILDCVSIFGLLQSCELPAVGSPSAVVDVSAALPLAEWVGMLRSHWWIAWAFIGGLQLSLTTWNLSFKLKALSWYGYYPLDKPHIFLSLRIH